jgi:hypothetical protein
MFARITQSLVAKTRGQSADFTLVDTVFPGLELRVRRTGGKTWVYRYRMNGGPQQRLKLGKFPGLTVVQARELALFAAADVAKGVDVRERQKATRATAERERASTLVKFIEEQYEPWARANLHTWKIQVNRIKLDFAAWLEQADDEHRCSAR